MEKINTIQAEDGFVICVGWLVKFHSRYGSSGVGLVREIKGDMVFIDPEWSTMEWPEDGPGDYWLLNPEARKAHGHVDYFGPRDHGISLGCITAIKPWAPKHVPANWTERS